MTIICIIYFLSIIFGIIIFNVYEERYENIISNLNNKINSLNEEGLAQKQKCDATHFEDHFKCKECGKSFLVTKTRGFHECEMHEQFDRKEEKEYREKTLKMIYENKINDNFLESETVGNWMKAYKSIEFFIEKNKTIIKGG